jgi:hypothetical protein
MWVQQPARCRSFTGSARPVARIAAAATKLKGDQYLLKTHGILSRSNIELRSLSWTYAAWRYSLINGVLRTKNQ